MGAVFAIARAFPPRLGPRIAAPTARFGLCAAGAWPRALAISQIKLRNRCRHGCPKKKSFAFPPGHAHDALKVEAFVECSNCGELKRPHHLCVPCGHYNGREVIAVGL